uniref:Matrilin 4 n=1 Tax=Homo sapiens TaxID=9606 RepID=A0A8I5KYX9_HUMAN
MRGLLCWPVLLLLLQPWETQLQLTAPAACALSSSRPCGSSSWASSEA